MWWRGALSRHGKTFGAATAAIVAGVGAFATVSEQTHIKTTEAQGPTVVGMLQEIANGVSRMEATLGNLKDASPSSFAAPQKGSMSYVLHNRLGSGGFVVEATLALAGLDFVYKPIESIPNTSVKPLVEHINPWGQIPILETPDGKILTEVAAILAYLVQQEHACRSGPHLFNPDPAAFLRWSVFLSVNIYEGVLRKCYPHRFFESVSCEETDQIIAGSIQKSAKKRTHEAFLLLEEHVIEEGAFLLGPKLSACDIYLAMLYAWHNKQPDLPKCTEITRRVATHKLIQPIWERNFHDRLDEKWQI